MTRSAIAVTLSLLMLGACGGADTGSADADRFSPILQAVQQRPLTNRSFASTPARLERGRHLATSILQCVACHSPLDDTQPGHPPIPGREFSGQVLWDRTDERLVAPNLTPDLETGAGSWSDDVFARAIREGVGHDGRALSLPMYWGSLRNLSDEDLASVVVFIRSVPAVRNPLPQRRLTHEREKALRGEPMPLIEIVPERDLSDPTALGAYLIDVSDCVGCHTAWEAPSLPGAYGGGNHITDRAGLPVHSRNITPDPSGIGGLSAADFRWVMRTGRGGTLDPVMRWQVFRNLTDPELDAIFAALQGLPPVAHIVGNGVEPTPCPVCGQIHGLGSANPEPQPLVGVALVGGRMEDFAGRYEHPGWGVTLEVRMDDGVLVASEGGPAVPLVHVGGEVFRGRGLPSPIRFERDSNGRVVAALYQDLREERFARVSGG